MGVCKDCAYWVDATYTTYRVKDKKVCDAVGEDDASGTYLDVHADDEWGLWAQFVTAPDFGCNKFHPKE
jgi:hypothetical protein